MKLKRFLRDVLAAAAGAVPAALALRMIGLQTQTPRLDSAPAGGQNLRALSHGGSAPRGRKARLSAPFRVKALR